jgi:predicted nucleic acid-binding protein
MASTSQGAVISISVDGAQQSQRQIDSVAQSLNSMATRGGASAAQLANAMRMVPAQLTDIVVGLQGGQAPLTVLLQQGGQLRDMFGSATAAARGVATSILGLVNPYSVAAAVVGALAYAYSEGSKEADAYSRSIIMSGNVAGTSTSQLADMAAAISSSVGTQADAAKVLAQLTGTGQVSADNLKQFSTTAIKAQRDLGRSVDDTVKDFAELGKSPVEASLKLNDAYHYLTASTYAQIKALADQGHADDAAELAQKTYSEAFSDRADKMEDNLGSIEKAWRTARETASLAWDAFLGVGRKKTPQQRMAEIDAELARPDYAPVATGNLASDLVAMSHQKNSSNRPALLKEKVELQYEIDKGNWDAQQAAVGQQLNKTGIEWGQEMEKYLSTAQREKKEIDRVTNLGISAGASDADIQKAVAKVKSNYSSLNNVTLTQLENQRDLQKEIMAGQAADLDSQYKLQLISQNDYLARKRDMQVKEIDLEVPILKKQAEIAGGKEDQSAREKANGELERLMVRRANIIKGAANADKEADFARSKAMNDLIAGWDRAIGAETDALTQEIALFGQSDQVRQVAIAQIKLETDARKFIADQAKDGHALTQQEIDDLKLKTDARKKSTAEVMNERAAIAGAQQLQQENRKFSADYIADEQLRAQAVLDLDSEKWRELIQNTDEGSEAQKKLIEQFDQWYSNRQMAPILDKWRGVIDGIDGDFREGFRDMLTGGQTGSMITTFAKSIGNAVKTSLATALYDTFFKKYVVQVVTSFAGGISGPEVASALSGSPTTAGATGTATSAIGAVQAASNLYKAVTGGFDSLSGSVADAIQAGFDKTGLSGIFDSAAPNVDLATGITSNGAAAGMAGTAAAYGAGMLGGHYIGNAIAGDYSVGHGQTVTNVATAVGAALLGPIGGVVGGVVGGLFNRAFGRGSTEVQAQGMRGTLTANTLTGDDYQKLHQDGGWFRSDKDWNQDTPFDAKTTAQFTQGLQAIESASSGFAKSLGVSADWVSTYSKTFDIAITGDATKDQQAITDFFNGVGDEIANKLVPNLTDFMKSGETASTTLERLAGDFQSTDQVAQLIGKTAVEAFGAAGIASAKAREQLIGFAGSASTLTSEAQSFAQNYLTDAEKLAPVQKALDAAMSDLGLSSVQTREQFKATVTSLDLTTDAGQKQFVSMMQLAEAFAQVHPASDNLSTLLELQGQTFEALGDKVGAAAVLEKQHQIALEGLSPALAEANKALWAAQAAEKAKADTLTLSTSTLELQAQIYELTGDKAGSATVLLQQHQAALAETDPALRLLTQQLWDLQAASTSTTKAQSDASALLSNVDAAYSTLDTVIQREKDALQKRIDIETDVVSKLTNLGGSIKSALSSFDVASDPVADRKAAQATLGSSLALMQAGKILSDDQTTALQDALTTATKDSKGQFGSSEDYMFDMLKTQRQIAQLGDVTKDQETTEQKQLDLMKAQSTAFDDQLAAEKRQVDLLKGIDTSGVTTAQALQGIQMALAAAHANPVAAATPAIADAYQAALGRAPDASGMAYWQGQVASGTSTSDVVSSIKKSKEAQIDQLYESLLGRAPDAEGLAFYMGSGASLAAIEADIKGHAEYKAKIPGFATGGDHAGGWRLVGEDGPELEATGPARIFNAKQTSGMLSRLGTAPVDNTALLTAALAKMQETMEKLRAETRATAMHSAKTANLLKRVIKNDTMDVSAPKPLATTVTTV